MAEAQAQVIANRCFLGTSKDNFWNRGRIGTTDAPRRES